jgi:hypothetical protein
MASLKGQAVELVGPGAAPSSAPTVALAAGSGVETGSHDYAYVFVTAAGQTLPSPIATIAVGLITSPAAAPTAGAPSSGGSMDVGAHRYYAVFRTAAGSTTAGPVSNAISVTLTAAPTSIGTAEAPSDSGVGFMDASSAYAWKYTFRRLSDGAETTASPASNSVVTTAAAQTCRVSLSGGTQAPPIGYDRRWYRTEGNGGTYKACPEVDGDFTGESAGSGYFFDGAADASLGAVEPSSNGTATGTCAISNIPVSAESPVTHVDLYREFNSAGASTAKLAVSVTNGTTTANDTTANASLGATVPSSNTAVANRVSVTFPAGPTGTTDIELYRTAIGSSQLKKFHTVGSNTGGSVTDSTADASLGANAPSGDTSGLAQPEGLVVPGDTSVPVANPGEFESNGGWAISGNGQQVFSYTGKSASALTGVPTSGTGSIAAPIQYNTTISPAPFLSGIPASGEGSIEQSIVKGDDLNMLVTVNDTDAQTLLSSLIGGDGVRVLQDGDRRLTYDESVLRALAMLELRREIDETLRYRVRDKNSRAGRNVAGDISLLFVNDDYRIQEVRIHNFTEALFPWFDVVASKTLFTFEELLYLVRKRAA